MNDMASYQTLLLTISLSLWMIVLFQTCFAKPSSSCTPSACGNIRNILPPFRLKDDPANCGDRLLELTCENNVTSIYLNSHKYFVKSIRMYTDELQYMVIRVVDASISNDDICSFPNSSLYTYSFDRAKNPRRLKPFNVPRLTQLKSCPTPLKNLSLFADITPHCVDIGYTYSPRIDVYEMHYPWNINLMSCPTQLKINSPLLIDITHDCASISSQSHSRFTYIKVGRMKASEVPETCTVELMVMSSFQFNDSINSLSLSDIHHSLLYGLNLFFDRPSYSYTKWEKFADFFGERIKRPLLILLAIVVIPGAVCNPVMGIIGITLVLGVLLTIIHSHFNLQIVWWDPFRFDPLDIYTKGENTVFDLRNNGISSIIIILAPRLIIFPLLVWFFIFLLRRRRLSTFDTIEDYLQSDNRLAPIRYSYSDIKKMTRGFRVFSLLDI